MTDTLSDFFMRDWFVSSADLYLQRVRSVELRDRVEEELIERTRLGSRSTSSFHLRHRCCLQRRFLAARLEQQDEPHRTAAHQRSTVLGGRVDDDRIDLSQRAEANRMQTNFSARYTRRISRIDQRRLSRLVHQLAKSGIGLRDNGEANDVRG